MPDFTPHVLLVRGLPKNQSVPSALTIYLRNSCGVSPTAVDVSEDVARVTFAEGQGQTLFTMKWTGAWFYNLHLAVTT